MVVETGTLIIVFFMMIFFGVITNMLPILGNMFVNFALLGIITVYWGVAEYLNFPQLPIVVFVGVSGYFIGTFISRIIKTLGGPTP